MPLHRLLLAPLLFIPLLASADEIYLTGEPYCPYVCADKEGFMLEITRTILEENGHQVHYTNLPWSRALREIRAGDRYVGLVGTLKPITPDLIYPEASIGKIEACYFTTSDNSWNYSGLASLAEVRLGLVQDYGYDRNSVLMEHLKQYGNNPSKVGRIIDSDTTLRLVRMTLAGRFSAFTEDRQVVNHVLRKNGIKGIREAGCIDTDDNMYIAFSPNAPHAHQYAAEITEGVERLRRSGRLQQILDKYLYPPVDATRFIPPVDR